ncbi:hypothetical protein FHX80_113673 [Streptomyces brevispora]|uniref:Uncharacterized protein n=1 Tax=Streptomyces brevispora TaxID=887462 RepID=A0A561V0Q7_9ACTN|nr:hypothetical protein FHX80_113673 [Streptomyces brevispora]
MAGICRPECAPPHEPERHRSLTPVTQGPREVPVSLLTVGSFVEFPVSGGVILSYDRTNDMAAVPLLPRCGRRCGRFELLHT